MMSGRVGGEEALVEVIFLSPGKATQEITFVIDTGFEGALALPANLVASLELEYHTDMVAILADDSRAKIDIHKASIIWQGSEIRVAVLKMGSRPLIGTSLLFNSHLGIDFVHNGAVSITELQ